MNLARLLAELAVLPHDHRAALVAPLAPSSAIDTRPTESTAPPLSDRCSLDAENEGPGNRPHVGETTIEFGFASQFRRLVEIAAAVAGGRGRRLPKENTLKELDRKSFGGPRPS